MTDIFSMVLVRDSAQLCLVLNWHSFCNETLLEDECDVSALNTDGRTVSILLRQMIPFLSHDINRNSSYIVYLDNADCELRWTPMQYATISKNWIYATWFLETHVDRSGLDMITKGTRSTLHWTNHRWGCGIRSRVTSWVFIRYRYEHSSANL